MSRRCYPTILLSLCEIWHIAQQKLELTIESTLDTSQLLGSRMVGFEKNTREDLGSVLRRNSEADLVPVEMKPCNWSNGDERRGELYRSKNDQRPYPPRMAQRISLPKTEIFFKVLLKRILLRSSENADNDALAQRAEISVDELLPGQPCPT